MDTDFWLKVAQIVAGLTTPIIVTVLGVVLVRRIEGIKADTTKQSAFHVRWADEFFDACQQFLRALERETVILIFLTHTEEKNNERGMEMQREQTEAHLLAYELQLRIRRCAVFSPNHRDQISKIAEDLFSSINKAAGGRVVKLEPIFEKLNEFNRCARQAHADILALGRTKRHEGSKV